MALQIFPANIISVEFIPEHICLGKVHNHGKFFSNPDISLEFI